MGVGIVYVKNFIAVTEFWVDDGFEMIAVEVKGLVQNIRGKLCVFTELQMRICWRLED